MTAGLQDKVQIASQEMTRQTVHWVPKIGVSILIFIAFWVFAALLAKFIHRFTQHGKPSRQVVFRLMAQSLKVSLIVVGIATALGTVGINVSALVAGLGLTGFALGLALKDIVQNVVSGAMILLFQPFEIEDTIAVTGFEGKVMNIELRYTVLQKEDKFILIPNSSIFTNPVVITPASAAAPKVATPNKVIPS